MLKKIILLGFILHLLIAVWNGFYGPSLGGESDAADFHDLAVSISQDLRFEDFRIGYISYCNALGVFYHLLTDSLFLGSLLSCFAWLGSAVLLIKSMQTLAVPRRNQIFAATLYALLPSSVMLTSITLREPYELLFVNLALYAAVQIYVKQSKRHWLLFFVAQAGMSVLHGAMFMSGLIMLVALIVLLAFRSSTGVPVIRLLFAAPLIIALGIFGLSLFTNVSYNLEEGLGASVQSYQQGGLGADARAQYKDNVEIDGLLSLLMFVPVSFLQYLFEPMPWRVSSLLDIAALVENTLRAWLLWLAWVGLRRMPNARLKPVMFIAFCYIAMECIWSLGTVNWGTAIRHHLPSFGLLLVVAFAYAKPRGTKRVFTMRPRFKLMSVHSWKPRAVVQFRQG